MAAYWQRLSVLEQRPTIPELRGTGEEVWRNFSPAFRAATHGCVVGQEVIREAFVEKGEYFSNRPTLSR